ncbi:MAG: hypothetical protein NTY48_06160 [Candidatus Diapherotrites archaeon]|nr:hypothetical protein [Candidatus Diapherotrites archaeon]
MAPALRTYLSQNKLTNIAAFCTMGGNDSKSFITDFNQCFGKTKAFLGIQTVIVKKGNINGQVEEFVKLLN